MEPSTTAERQPEGKQEQVHRSEREEAALAASQEGAPGRLSKEEIQLATDWFMSEEPEPPTLLEFRVNVAAAGLPARWIKWSVRSLTRKEIRDIRRDATNDAGVEDDMEVNMRVLIAASVEPNLKELAQQRGVADPADLVNKRFGHKPGLIEAIARKANEMSGYGASTDIVQPIDAAGN